MRQAALLFVYGTMLSTGCNHARLRDAMLIGEFESLDRFAMGLRESSLDQIVPIAVRDRDGYPVRGELYALPWLTVLDRIDAFEGHPDVYRRERVRLRGLSRVPTEMYIFRKPLGAHTPTVLPVNGVLAFRGGSHG